MANITASASFSNISVTNTPANITVTDTDSGNISTVTVNTSNIAVATTTSNVIVADLGTNFSNTLIRNAISVTDTGGDGSLSYTSTSGVITYTGPSQAEVLAHFSNVSPINLEANGQISVDESAIFSGKTTDDLTEGSTNLYYTNARVLAYITDNGLDFNAEKVDDRVANLLQTTGNLTFTYDDGANTLTLSQSLTTDDISEGVNQYYTTAKANSAIVTYLGDSGNAPFTIAGNLNVTGNLNYENVTDLYVTDQKITLNANAASDATVEIIANRPVAGANTSLEWNETTDKWTFTNDGSTYYPMPTDSDDLAEGSTNLYYTNAKVITAITEGNVKFQEVAETVVTANTTITGYFGSGNTGNVDQIVFETDPGLATSDSITLLGTTNPNLSFLNGNTYQVFRSDATTYDLYEAYPGTPVTSGLGSVGPVGLYVKYLAFGNISIDVSQGTLHNVEAVGNITGITFDNIQEGTSGTIILHQDSVGFRLLDTTTYAGNWSTWEFVNDFKTLTPNANSIDLINFVYDGANIIASIENVDQLNIETTANITTTGDITGANLLTGGNIKALSGNVFASYLHGDGSNISGVSSLTNAQAQAYIQENGLAMTNTITSNNLISTTGNLQVNADTSINGLKGLTFDNTNNFLGLGTTTPGTMLDGSSEDSAIHIQCVDQFHGTLTIEEALGNPSGPEINFVKAGYDTANSALAAVQTGNRIGEIHYEGYDGSAYQDRLYHNAFVDGTVSSGTIPMGWEIRGNGLGTSTNRSMFKVRGNGAVQVGIMNNDDDSVGTNATIQSDGNISTAGKIDATGTITGGTLTDGTLTTTAGTLTGATSITSTTFTDGSFSVTGGNFTTVGSIGATGNIETNGNITSYSAGGFIGNFNGDGSNISGLTTDIVSEATNLYYTDARSRAAVSVTSNTPSGNGSLSYDNSTGVFTFTPADASGGGISNADAKAYIEANGLNATANIETSTFFIGDLDGAVVIDVNNNTGATLNKGEAVYLTGGNSGDNPNVALADSDDATKMPAIGIVRENISDTAVGQVVTSGVMNNSGHGYTLGADLYISDVAGGLTTTIPTGESKGVQKIGKVVSANHILVQGAFRTNATPNLDENKIFIGNAANRATTVALDNLTQNIKTTGNLQLDPSSNASGLLGLTYDSTNHYLGLGTETPERALHIVASGGVKSQIYMDEYDDGPSANDIRMRRAEGLITAPRFVNTGEHIGQWYHYPWRENADPTGNAAFSDTYGGSFATSGGVEISSFADGDYLINIIPVNTLEARGGSTGDRLRFTDGTIRFNNGTIFVLDGTTNANLTSLNGQAFYVTRGGTSSSNYFELYYDEARTLPVQVATGTENFTDGNANVVATAQPVGLELIINEDKVDRNSQRRITKWRANGEMQFGCSDTDKDGTPTATIDVDGVFTTQGNISGANVIGTYLYGDGTNISGIGGSVNSFESIAVSGGNTVVAESGTDTLNLVAAGAITITADAATDTITIGGTGGTYGNVDVENFLSANVVTANIETQGNIVVNQDLNVDNDVKAANALFTDRIFSYTSGGTISFTSPRFSDAGFGNYFFPDVGGNTDGGVLQSASDSVGFFSNSISNLNTLTVDDVIIRDRLRLKSYSNTEILALTGLTAGEVVYNSTDNLVSYYDGTNWRNIAQGAIVT